MKELIYLVKSDLYRYKGESSWLALIKALLTNKGFKFTFWMRLTHHFQGNKFLFIVPYLFYAYYKRVLVTDINYKAKIGPGFQFFHVFATTFGDQVSIGKNFVLSHCVTIGATKRGEKMGAPTIGDNVYVGPGALIVGKITIGNNVVIGGHAVVTKDVPDNSVVVGNPGKVISSGGSDGYVVNTDYDMFLANRNTQVNQ